jgi:hypothetical protein
MTHQRRVNERTEKRHVRSVFLYLLLLQSLVQLLFEAVLKHQRDR